MSAARVQKYVIREILAPTLLCMLIFTMVLLMGRLAKLVDMVVNNGVSINDILILLGTMLPAFLNITLPLAFLMGIMIGLSRMSADSEVVALKSAGIGLAQVARPVLSLALIICILTGLAGFWLKPWGFRAFRDQIFAIAMQKATIGFQPRVFMKQFDNMVLYADTIDDRTGTMHGLFIADKKPDATMMIFAEQGDIIADDANQDITFRLREGTIHRQQTAGGSGYQLIHFRNYEVKPDLDSGGDLTAAMANRQQRPKEMSTAGLWQQMAAETATGNTQRHRAIRAEMHTRMATPMAPLIFALFGLPFSIQSHRSGRSGGFVIGLIIYLCYYLLLSLAETFTAEAGMTPWLTFWLPHLLMVMAGLYCLNQSAHEQPNAFVLRIEQLTIFLKNRFSRNNDHS